MSYPLGYDPDYPHRLTIHFFGVIDGMMAFGFYYMAAQNEPSIGVGGALLIILGITGIAFYD